MGHELSSVFFYLDADKIGPAGCGVEVSGESCGHSRKGREMRWCSSLIVVDCRADKKIKRDCGGNRMAWKAEKGRLT